MSFAKEWGAAACHFGGGQRRSAGLALGLLALGGACAGGEADPDPFGAPGAGGAPLGSATAGAAGNVTPGGNATPGGNGGGSAAAGGSNGAAGGTTPAGGTPSNAAGAAAIAGAGGATPTRPSAGAAGTSLIPAEPVGEADAPSSPDIACPASASFCSGFETPALPSGARFDSNPTTALAFDGTLSSSGRQSLSFPAIADGFNIREVVVPIPGNTFWVRLFMRTDTVFGDNDHDSVFVASTTLGDNNSEDGVEFSEQGNQVLLNSNDQLFSAAGAGFPSGAGPTLAAETWHCMEGFFDGASGDVQIFAGGELLIDAPGYRPLTYQTFRFGYLQFPGGAARSVWFDDVVVASDRIGCE